MNGEKGFSLIELLIVAAVIAIIAAIAIPTYSKIAANEASAIASVKLLCTAEYNYAGTTGTGEFAPLSDLTTNGMIDTLLGSGSKSGYTFNITTGSSPAAFTITASAQGPTSGIRSFSATTDGIIYTNGAAVIGGK